MEVEKSQIELNLLRNLQLNRVCENVRATERRISLYLLLQAKLIVLIVCRASTELSHSIKI